jgi:hypothetical protein
MKSAGTAYFSHPFDCYFIIWQKGVNPLLKYEAMFTVHIVRFPVFLVHALSSTKVLYFLLHGYRAAVYLTCLNYCGFHAKPIVNVKLPLCLINFHATKT